MTARVLVVDDLEPNVKLLEAKLRAEYFEVYTAFSGLEAIEIAHKEQPDIILLDVMMPVMDGFEACRRLKADHRTCHIPVVMVTALDQQADRVAGLEAGADDFLTKPVEDIALFARVRSLTRLKMMTDELRLGHAAGAELGILTNAKLAEFDTLDSRVLIIDDTGDVDESLIEPLPDNCRREVMGDVKQALETMRTEKVDLVIVNLNLENYDSLRFCSAVRTLNETRLTPLLALVRQGDTRKLVRALDLGVNDYIMRPVDQGEITARVRTQLRRKHYIDQLRESFQVGLELAVTDQLTGLYNRRYLANHMSAMFDGSNGRAMPVSVLIVDVDHFKAINDTYGHDCGDIVLQGLAKRLTASIRGMDIACRYGGEEFVLLMPKTDSHTVAQVAERLRQEIGTHPIDLGGERSPVDITVSIGAATAQEGDTPQAILKRADEALYRAKEQGRNRVVFDTAA